MAKKENEEVKEGVDIVNDVTALGTLVSTYIDRIVDAAKRLQTPLDKGAFKRLDSIQLGYGAIKQASDDLGLVFDRSRLEAIERDLTEVYDKIIKKEAK